jgi:hypothetical protein
MLRGWIALPGIPGRKLEGEEPEAPGIQLEYILLLSLLLCLFWWPCVKLFPVVGKSLWNFLALISGFCKDLKKKPVMPVELEHSAATVKHVTNKKGHISDKPPKMFFDD